MLRSNVFRASLRPSRAVASARLTVNATHFVRGLASEGKFWFVFFIVGAVGRVESCSVFQFAFLEGFPGFLIFLSVELLPETFL